MKTQEYLKCRRYFENHMLNSPTVVGFKDLFTLFSSFGISTVEELENSASLFEEFFNTHILNEFEIDSEKQLKKLEKRFDSFKHMLKTHLNPHDIQIQRDFSDIVTEFISNKHSDRILDVGAGRIPHSSIKMAETVDHVSAMDHMTLSAQCLKKLNVDAKLQYFNPHTNITHYDYVVGRCPCSAIEYIAKKCAKNNKGYLIQLCNCNLPYGADSWEDILPEHDSKVKFYMDYAYNLDATPAQVERTIDRFNPDRHVLKSIKPTTVVSYVQNVKLSDWKIDDTPNEVTPQVYDDEMDL